MHLPPDPDAGLKDIAVGYASANWEEAWDDAPEEARWLYEPVLEAGTVNALFGPPGTGKSLLALEIAARLACAGIHVVYIDDENRLCEDVVPRLKDMSYGPADLGCLHFYSFASLPPLDTGRGAQHLLALAVTRAAELVILDTTTRMVQGRENDSDTFLALYRESLVPLKKRGITVLRLDHPGKNADQGQRGSSAKDGDVDTVWKLTEQVPGTRYRLERTKSRSGHGEPVHWLTRRTYPLRHDWAVAAPVQPFELAGQLDQLGVPRDAGRPTARKALDAAGVKVRNEQLEETIRIRKLLPPLPPD